jgi:hypothetical protein
VVLDSYDALGDFVPSKPVQGGSAKHLPNISTLNSGHEIKTSQGHNSIHQMRGDSILVNISTDDSGGTFKIDTKESSRGEKPQFNRY